MPWSPKILAYWINVSFFRQCPVFDASKRNPERCTETAAPCFHVPVFKCESTGQKHSYCLKKKCNFCSKSAPCARETNKWGSKQANKLISSTSCDFLLDMYNCIKLRSLLNWSGWKQPRSSRGLPYLTQQPKGPIQSGFEMKRTKRRLWQMILLAFLCCGKCKSWSALWWSEAKCWILKIVKCSSLCFSPVLLC